MDKKQKLLERWLEEEKQAHIKGWDFSHIKGRYSEAENLPWDLRAIIKNYLKDDMQLLDMETGGGEFLLSLNHSYKKTAAIEGYPPNVRYCKEKLLPLGIDFKAADGADILPFADNTFDIITNRHGDYNILELKRLLKDGGLFITQQVGAENDRALVELLLGDTALPYPELYLDKMSNQFAEAGFEILRSEEVFSPIKFYDIAALVWFARIIEWEFPGFSVEKCLDNLYKAQAIIEKNGVIEGQTHRFYLVVRKV